MNSKFILITQINCKIIVTKIILPIDILDQTLALKEDVFMFSIITTNKKSTAIAPT